MTFVLYEGQRAPRAAPPKGWRWRNVQPHGTWAAYQRHWKAGEEPCEACKVGARAHWRAAWHRRQHRPTTKAAPPTS